MNRPGRPAPLDLQTAHPVLNPSLPTPPSTGDSAGSGQGFKMFSWKRRSPAASPPGESRPVWPEEKPTPILRQPGHEGGGASIRFDAQRGQQYQHQPAPSVIVTSYESTSQGHEPSRSYESSQVYAHSQYGPTPLPMVARAPSPQRRSSRPSSPATTSFGTRQRFHSAPAASSSGMSQVPAHMQAGPLSTPPMPSSHITTPPTAYCSTMQSRAPPPPSPYRPTNERRLSLSTRTSIIPEQLPMTSEFAPRPPRHSSLLTASDSMRTLPDAQVPMLNIIPATPQDANEEFSGAWMAPKRKRLSGPLGLEEAVCLEGMEEIPLDTTDFILPAFDPLNRSEPAGPSYEEQTPGPSIDLPLNFSPFRPTISLPTSTSIPSIIDTYRPSDPLPPSPPFDSYPSLPSLESSTTMPSSASESSMPTSSSNSSLMSFPDVEEALGSMLASLSEHNLDSAGESDDLDLPAMNTFSSSFAKENLGLGLGLDIPDSGHGASITAPLSPRRRMQVAPLNLSGLDHVDAPAPAPVRNHRVAFYGTATAAPKSPTSGIFILYSPTETYSTLNLNFDDTLSSSSSVASDASSSLVSDSSPVVRSNATLPSEAETIGLGLGWDNSYPGDRRSGSTITSVHGSASSTTLGQGYRDSISLTSESSDDDLHTASIVCLTPVSGGSGGLRGLGIEVGEEMVEEVGLAL